MSNIFGIVDWSTYAYRHFSKWVDGTREGDNFTTCFSRDAKFIADELYDQIISSIKVLSAQGYNIDPCVICFDCSGSEARKAMLPDYKGHRKPLFNEQIEELKEQVFIELKNIAKKHLIDEEWIYLEVAGYEADDIIYVCCKDLLQDQIKFILTGDRDMYQLIDSRTGILTDSRGELTEINLSNFSQTSGIQDCPPYETPQGFLMGKILQGDRSDNIPGYKGIGAKKAHTLVHRYKTFNNILKSKVIDDSFTCHGLQGALSTIRKEGSGIFKKNTQLIDISYVAKNKYFRELLVDQFNHQIARLP